MEIIIRMEEKENPTVGAALREMAKNAWVQIWLPKLTETAKSGGVRRTEYFSDLRVSGPTLKMVQETFGELGIQVDFYWNFSTKQYVVTFSWA